MLLTSFQKPSRPLCAMHRTCRRVCGNIGGLLGNTGQVLFERFQQHELGANQRELTGKCHHPDIVTTEAAPLEHVENVKRPSKVIFLN